MPKATLEFDLNDYDERLAHKRAVHADEVYLVVLKTENILKEIAEFIEEKPGLSKKPKREIEDFIDKKISEFNVIMDSYNVSLDDLP